MWLVESSVDRRNEGLVVSILFALIVCLDCCVDCATLCVRQRIIVFFSAGFVREMVYSVDKEKKRGAGGL